MRYVEINGNEITTRQSLHEAFRKAMDFDDCYGANLDALYDELSVCFDKVTIRITDPDNLHANLGEYADLFMRVIHAGAHENPDYITVIIDDKAPLNPPPSEHDHIS